MKATYQFEQIIEGVRGIVFDFDGTLVDSINSWRTVDTNFFKKRGMDFDADEYLHAIMGKNLYECAIYTIERYNLHNEKPDDIVHEWKTDYQHYFETEVKLFPGVERVLAFLRQIGMPYAVATAGQAHLVSFFDKYPEIRPDAFVSCDDVNVGKPDPAVFREAMRRIGVNEHECLIFEDSFSGIEGARRTAAKLCGVFICEHSEQLAARCDFTIRDWRVLVE